ncbi:NADH-quinone oxidoreductase subunit J [Candidatus Phycosocius spiralis]|uniref:NADH-quinone oxidoreductase subunit J n=1 Tax=Candidatus Phycosocius spiralis TaxID=2815099 RepID=A0ABQ4PSZ7_9PROT|nr:NADH-quinone oxidoreductase subunit J [Candidatus Phycosocius spiralis]GIU66106.1 NADH:ubiquinone oxidoreductase subunit J [Candidatus Phycosocius spiralis]
MIAVAAFYILSAIAIAAAFMVVVARNPVHSVLFLILTFFTASGLFVLLGAEFLAMLLIVVYVGAVAVLFLFVVMMLDIDFAELKAGFFTYLPFGGLIALILFGQFAMVGGAWIEKSVTASAIAAPSPAAAAVSNAEAIGRILYTDYIFLFQAAGIILFIAMVGAIALTLRHRDGIRRQNVSAQVGRTRAAGVEMKDPKPGEGVVF